MRAIFILTFILVCQVLFAQSRSVMLVDVMSINQQHKAEALYYYEHNWKLYREEAIKQGVITGYQFYETENEDSLEFVLITEFKDESQYDSVEMNFVPILKTLRPGGPVLLNEVKPEDFRSSVSTKKAYKLWAK